MSSSLSCRQCGQPITFDNKHISQKTGKKIPLDVDTNEPHDCPVRREQQQTQLPPQSQQRRYLQCNKIENGKWIPLYKQTGLPHQC
jgi:hypothetical protein